MNGRKGLSLEEYFFKYRGKTNRKSFAATVPINVGYLSKITRGEVYPSVQMAKKISQATNGEVIWWELLSQTDTDEDIDG